MPRLGSPRHLASVNRDLSPSPLDNVERDEDIKFFERKKLRLHANGVPTRPIVSLFVKDLHAFTKELDPTVTLGWPRQSREAKKRF